MDFKSYFSYLMFLGLLIYAQARDFRTRYGIKDNFEIAKKDKHGTVVLTRSQLIARFGKQFKAPNKKTRKRRDANCPNPTDIKSISKYEYKFPAGDNHLSFSMTWVGKDFKTILLLATTEFFIFSIHRSALYRSTDYGVTFKKINTDIFGGHIRKDFGIQRSPIDPDWVILVSFSMPILARPSTLYISQDGAITWKKVSLPFRVGGGIEFHPRNKKWLIAKGSSLQQGAYLSTDFGFTWKKLRPYVMSVKWGARQDLWVEKDEQTVFLTTARVQNIKYQSFVNIYDLQLWRSRNLGKDFKLISSHVYSFGVQGPFLFFTVDFNKNNKTRIMHVSKDGGDTQDVAGVPSILPEQFYSILDMSEGMVFLHVDDPGDTGKGDLYTSDADGIVYDKSLANHVYTNFDSITDFYKVESMNGTYISSKMNDDSSLTSVITFDRGGEWNLIKLSDKSLCQKPGPCSLQIHSKFSQSRGVSGVAMPPLSDKNAVGIIVAHANPGPSLLRKNIGIWVSRDGGYTWKRKSKAGLTGAHHYAIADHGNLLLAIPYQPNVKSLWYSVNEGACWFQYDFSSPSEHFQFTGLVTSPGAKTMKANLWGYTTHPTTGRQWLVYTLNFRQLLSRSCVYNSQDSKSDYIKWIPHSTGKNKGCLLGKKITFLRPKPESLCFNGEDYIPQATIEYCPCTKADLECEYGYSRQVGDDTCKPDKTKDPQLCLHGDVVKPEHKGYRLVPGDMCDKHQTEVEKYIDTHIKCHNSSFYSYGVLIDDANMRRKNSKSVAAAVVAPIVLVALVIMLYFARKFWKVHKARPSYQYTSLSQDPKPLDDTSDNDDIFDDRTPGSNNYNDEDAAMIQV